MYVLNWTGMFRRGKQKRRDRQNRPRIPDTQGYALQNSCEQEYKDEHPKIRNFIRIDEATAEDPLPWGMTGPEIHQCQAKENEGAA